MLMIHSILHFLTIAAWAIFILYQIVIFLKAALTDGLRAGILSLLSMRRILSWLTVLILLSILNMALVFVKPNEMAVVVSIFKSNGIREKPLLAGVNLIVPFAEQAIYYPRSTESYTMASRPNEGEEPGDDSITARTSDGQEVKIDCSLQYKLIPDRKSVV